MTIGVIGLGLIGGSMALDLKRRSFADTVIGVENDPVHIGTYHPFCRPRNASEVCR